LYRNGIQIGQRTDLPATAVATVDGWIGAMDGSSYFLTGKVDDLAVYGSRLTRDDVADNYAAGLNGLTP